MNIPKVSDLPETVDPLNYIRQKVAEEIWHVCRYKKCASVVFPSTDDMFCVTKMVTTQDSWGNAGFMYPKTEWDMKPFETVAEECRTLGYKVEVEPQYKELRGNGGGVNKMDSIVMKIIWE